MNFLLTGCNMGLLTFEDGIVTLDGTELKGILQKVDVRTAVRFDEAKVDGASGKKKTPAGFEDSKVDVSMILLTDEDSDCYEKLEEINHIFKGIDKNTNPKIFTVTNRHLLARGIREVVFANLDSSENSSTDEIFISLQFVEHNPPVIKMEETKAKQPTAKELAEMAKNETSEPEEVLMVFDEVPQNKPDTDVDVEGDND